MGQVETAGEVWSVVTVVLTLLLGIFAAWTMVRNRQRARVREEQSARIFRNEKLIASRISGDRVTKELAR